MPKRIERISEPHAALRQLRAYLNALLAVPPSQLTSEDQERIVSYSVAALNAFNPTINRHFRPATDEQVIYKATV